MTDAAPSMKSLIAFEATARLGSMSAAGRELGTTQPAVSQRIRHLEDALGLTLFERGRHALRLTHDGRIYHDEVANSLLRITSSTRRMQSRARSKTRDITIAAHFGFAHLWLLPRLHRLEAAFPGTGFQILPVDRSDDGPGETADLEIRHGRFTPSAENQWPLLAERVFPVCSPGFAKRHEMSGELAESDRSLPLLHMDSQDPRWLDWAEWGVLAGFEAPAEPPRFLYHNYPLLLHAAIEGKGLALGWRGLVDDALHEGTLVALGPVIERPDRGYILCTAFSARALLQAIVQWFLRELGADAPPAQDSITHNLDGLQAAGLGTYED